MLCFEALLQELDFIGKIRWILLVFKLHLHLSCVNYFINRKYCCNFIYFAVVIFINSVFLLVICVSFFLHCTYILLQLKTSLVSGITLTVVLFFIWLFFTSVLWHLQSFLVSHFPSCSVSFELWKKWCNKLLTFPVMLLHWWFIFLNFFVICMQKLVELSILFSYCQLCFMHRIM